MGRVCSLPAYIFVYMKPAVNAAEVNKSINWVHQFKTESFVDQFCCFCLCFCYAFVRVCLLMPCGHLLGKDFPLILGIWGYKAS